VRWKVWDDGLALALRLVGWRHRNGNNGDRRRACLAAVDAARIDRDIVDGDGNFVFRRCVDGGRKVDVDLPHGLRVEQLRSRLAATTVREFGARLTRARILGGWILSALCNQNGCPFRSIDCPAYQRGAKNIRVVLSRPR
jgi:hypothetical protein